MPNVVGLEVGRAKELMDQQGFKNVRYEQVESQKPENEVIYQSVAKNTEIDVNSEVIIHYSLGPQETEPTAATEVPFETLAGPQEILITVTFAVPEREEEYRLDICTAGTNDVVASKMITPGTSSIYVALTGSGSVSYDLYMDGTYLYTPKPIQFTEEG